MELKAPLSLILMWVQISYICFRLAPRFSQSFLLVEINNINWIMEIIVFDYEITE